MRKILSIILAVFVCSIIAGQEVELQKNVDSTVYNHESGADKKVYKHAFLDLGQIIADKYELPGASWTFAVGMKVKYRITQTINLINGFQYRYLAYRLKQDVNNKTFPDNIVHTKQHYTLHQFGTDLAIRFNLDKRGNSIGWFVDLGGYAAATPFARLKTADETKQNSIAASQMVVQRKLTFPIRYEYGLTGRIGYTRYALYANYRLSSMFKTDYHFPELSKLVVGAQLGLHR